MATQKSDKPDKKSQFETTLEKLEHIVQSLESGDLGIEASLVQFEQGVELYKNCRKTLDSVEKKINILTEQLKEIEFKE